MKKEIAEFIGTFVLVLFGCGAAVIAGGAARRGEGRRVSHRGAGSRERGGTGEESRAEIGTAVARTHPEKSFVSSASWTCSSRPTIVSHPSSSPATSATDEAALDSRRAREETLHDAARWSPATREETRDAVSTARRSAHRDDIAGGGIGDARGRAGTTEHGVGRTTMLVPELSRAKHGGSRTFAAVVADVARPDAAEKPIKLIDAGL